MALLNLGVLHLAIYSKEYLHGFGIAEDVECKFRGKIESNNKLKNDTPGGIFKKIDLLTWNLPTFYIF